MSGKKIIALMLAGLWSSAVFSQQSAVQQPQTTSIQPQQAAQVQPASQPVPPAVQTGAQVGQVSAPQSLPPLPPGLLTPESAMESVNLVLSPDQIRKIRKNVEDMQQAASEVPSGVPPRPVTNSVVASLTPGATPPVIRLFKSFPTALVVVDSTGTPWPVTNFVADPSVDVHRGGESSQAEGASLSLTPKRQFVQGGISVYLKGQSVPVVLTFVSAQKEVDMRTEVRVNARGPNSRIEFAGLPEQANPSLLSLLDGVAPSGAKVLRVSGPAQAWMSNGKMLVRTPLSLISPAWISSVRSADGTQAYELMPISEIRAMKDGKIVTLSIDGI